MSEMLANHYFLVRNFISAKSLFEKVLCKDISNISIKKKLIICYVITGEMKRALDLFHTQIKDDIDVILKTDLKSEDCPCPDLIAQIENQTGFFKNELDHLAGLGILWLYCSIEKSIEYFNELTNLSSKDKIYTEILSILLNKLSSNKKCAVN